MAAHNDQTEALLTPAEVAAMFRVDPKTVTRWAKAGKLSAIRTLGGHRRYRLADVRALLESLATPVDPERELLEKDAARLYDEGWSIRQVAARFDCSYTAMRRILLRRTTLRRW